MKVLFSPSEMKSKDSGDRVLKLSNFEFLDESGVRENAVKEYAKFVANASDAKLAKLFGLKQIDESLRESIFEKGCVWAIERYSGVAYKALDFFNLHYIERCFLGYNTIIFSNLFGPILGRDQLPEYKLKQGEKFSGLDLPKIYRENFSAKIDEFLESEVGNGECVVDLRAGFYEKFYELKVPHLSFKFIKNGKVLSHYAKAYRGKVLREIARNSAQTEREILNLNFSGVKLAEIREISLKKEIVLEICEN
ncbi:MULTISPECIES: peroxide stress protein YaaA [unclassified Campylobacter]|uniref:peroxide stress protein YaaA n=1 Tax=unclassified Campylobacter TaxID=2593542 RepID=UPI0022E9F825|nr:MULTISPECIES: peroxide stress protein YaaA [unclassified Campylobacter]MDA3062638.1 YaaA family protein [Campylobacter sp. JMF_14 EL1]MDA3073894.1 YaaA family protein [Campylobacter sp. JMF_10 EL2]